MPGYLFDLLGPLKGTAALFRATIVFAGSTESGRPGVLDQEHTAGIVIRVADHWRGDGRCGRGESRCRNPESRKQSNADYFHSLGLSSGCCHYLLRRRTDSVRFPSRAGTCSRLPTVAILKPTLNRCGLPQRACREAQDSLRSASVPVSTALVPQAGLEPFARDGGSIEHQTQHSDQSHSGRR